MVELSLIETVETIQNMLVSRATGGAASDEEYKGLRHNLLSHVDLKPLVPRFVVTCRDLSQFWVFIKHKFAHYQKRREYIWEKFAPLLDKLEGEEPIQKSIVRKSQSGAIKILFLGANPSDTTRLRLDKEMREIDDVLRKTEYRDVFELKQHWAIRSSVLCNRTTEPSEPRGEGKHPRSRP